jgi:hypothetical protein
MSLNQQVLMSTPTRRAVGGDDDSDDTPQRTIRRFLDTLDLDFSTDSRSSPMVMSHSVFSTGLSEVSQDVDKELDNSLQDGVYQSITTTKFTEKSDSNICDNELSDGTLFAEDEDSLSLPNSFAASFLFDAAAERVRGGRSLFINAPTSCRRCRDVQSNYATERQHFAEKEKSLSMEKTMAHNRVSELELQLAQSERMLTLAQESAALETSNLRDRLAHSQTQLENETTQRISSEERFQRERLRTLALEDSEAEVRRLQKQVQEMQETHKTQLFALQRLTEEDRAHELNQSDWTRDKERFKLDLAHLLGERDRLTRLLSDSETRCEAEKLRAVEAEAQAAKATNQMLEAQRTLLSDFEDKRTRDCAQLQ